MINKITNIRNCGRLLSSDFGIQKKKIMIEISGLIGSK